MTKRETAAIVLAAGLGTRMRSSRPKVMHPLAGRPMIQHLLASLAEAGVSRVVAVIGPDMDPLARAIVPHPTVIQAERLGTGHAALQARAALDGFSGDVLILFGDTPLITVNTLRAMLAARGAASDPAVVALGFRPVDLAAYGRLVVGQMGLERIVENRDATEAERKITLCNSGVMAVDGARLFDLLARITNKNAKQEYYLTDIVGLARAEGRACSVVEGDPDELLGINSRTELAAAEAIVQTQLRRHAMEEGATLTDPASVFFSWDTKLGRDVSVGPHVVFGPGVTIEDEVEIRAFCHIEGARVRKGAVVGPFARLRPGADVGVSAHVGNFVEIKQSVLDEGAKVNHLTYIGDAHVGAAANVGAGTITCNYDGFTKGRTEIGAGAFIGSNAALVAPVKIGAGAIIGAGSVITEDVAPDAIAVARGQQKEIKEGAARFRAARKAKKKG